MLAVACVFIAVSAATSRVLDSGAPQFSPDEASRRRVLEAELERLVLDRSDIAALPGDFYDCSDEVSTGLYFDFGDGEGGVPGDLESAKVVEDGYSRIALSEHCEQNNVIWVSSIVHLPSTKESITEKLRTYEDFADGNGEDLDKLVRAYTEGYYPDIPWSEPAWVAVPGLGDGGYAYKFTLHYPDYPEPMVVHDFTFIRDVVYGSLTVRLPGGPGSERQAIALAETLDRKIETRLQVVLAGPIGDRP